MWCRVVYLAVAAMVAVAQAQMSAARADQGLPPGTAKVPPDTQFLVESAFAPQLVLPATAMWRFEYMKPYGSGQIVCGHVNFQRSTRQYIGFLGFYAVVRHGRVGISGIEAENAMQDPTGSIKFAYDSMCHTN